MARTAVDEKWTMNKLNGGNWSSSNVTLVAGKRTLGSGDRTEQLRGNANAQT